MHLKWTWLLDFLLPGWAHVEYWSDLKTLRYILGRTYGRKFLYDEADRPWPPLLKRFLAGLGLLFWATVLLGGSVGVRLGIPVWFGAFSWSDLWDFVTRMFPRGP